MTGSEAALQVLHGCFFGASFSNIEKDLLMNLCSFAHRKPGLKILASSILHKSERCEFLVIERGDESVDIDCTNELDEYSAKCAQVSEHNPLRTHLEEAEESLLLGNMLQQDMVIKSSPATLLDLEPSPVRVTYVSETEALFSRFLSSPATVASPPPLPLTLQENDPMGKEMNVELVESWNSYHYHSEKQLTKSGSTFSDTCRLVLKDATRERRQSEQYRLECVEATRSHARGRLLHMINYLPTPTITDILRSSFDDEVLLQLLPRLNLSAKSVFRAATLQYMELCVLEDKLEQLVVSGQQSPPPSASYFLDELTSVRTWESEDHPYWLAFEVEGRFQIRSEQYTVTKHLIVNPGPVCQMNMGRGKTKVILPMLFLYYSHRHRDRVVRAHFLTSLLSETRQFMHRNLSASSILGLHFVEHPFHRNTDLDMGLQVLARICSMLPNRYNIVLIRIILLTDGINMSDEGSSSLEAAVQLRTWCMASKQRQQPQQNSTEMTDTSASTSASAPASAADAMPRELVLRHVLLFHRHGDRTPVLTTIGDKWQMTPEELAFWETKAASKETLAKLERAGKMVGADPSLPPPPPSKRDYSYPLGELTQKGVDHMRGKGKKLKERYGHLVAAPIGDNGDAATDSSNNSDHVFVLSSSVPRTVQSVQCLLHGMFHDDDDETEPAVSDVVATIITAEVTAATETPVAIEATVSAAADGSSKPTFHIRTYERNVLAPSHSLRVFMEIEAIVSDEVEKREQHEKEEMAALALHLRDTLGISHEVTMPWTAIRDGLTCRLAHDLPLPEGITQEMFDQICAYDTWLWYRLYEKKEFCFKAFKYGVREVYEHLKKVVTENPRPAPKLSFFSAHDNSIVALVSALQLQVGPELPEYGTIVAFEIYEDQVTKEHYVKVLFEDREVPFAGHEHDPLCPFTHFEALAMDFLTIKEEELEQ